MNRRDMLQANVLAKEEHFHRCLSGKQGGYMQVALD